MKPIRDISDLTRGTVLHHSAFGFARITAVEADGVSVEWQDSTADLPRKIPADTLRRVYSICQRDGFFEQAVDSPDAAAERLQTRPADALIDLLSDLDGPQRLGDLSDWIVGRGLLTPEGFDRWWRMVQPMLASDRRLVLHDGVLALMTAGAVTPVDPDSPPQLTPSRMLEIAISGREALGEAGFLDQLALALRTGGLSTRDAALAAGARAHAEEIVGRLVVAEPPNLAALSYVITNAGWSPDDLSTAHIEGVVELVLTGCVSGGPLDHEGALASVLYRWSPEPIVDALAEVAPTVEGKRLLRATFGSMPPERAEALGLQLLDDALGNEDGQTSQWLGGELLGFALLDAASMAARISERHPALAEWYRFEFVGVGERRGTLAWDDNSDDTAYTAEVDMSALGARPVALSDLPARSGANLIGLGLAIARALALHHKDGHVVNPSAPHVRLLPDQTIEADLRDDDIARYHLAGEPPSQARDVYAGAVILVELLLGRPWPADIPAYRCVPYLRTVVTLLPPAALAPIESALHPSPALRPASGLEWVVQWQAAAVSEENRVYGKVVPNGRLRIGYDSHIGRMKVLVTQTNQDAVFISSRGPLSLLLVCDGISTANAGSGDVASNIACHVVANLWEQALPRLGAAGPPERRAFLDRVLRAANTAVCDAALRFAGGDLDGRIPMGTTVVVALVHGNHVSLAWLGDSRGYLVGASGASLLTSDENQAGERLKAWHLRFLDRWEPAGFALVGYLGHFNELLQPEALPAHHTAFTLLPGEHLVLCSDGVTDYAAETGPEVGRLIAAAAAMDDPDEIARELVALANRAGGGDNASCVIATLA
ncbi:MAG: serine/threonine protein phosphatase PrpC [Myxococcota bacterium]|jgi:serine/threonine protein phosphatase PrpC